jgi:hypothetical protein
MGVNGRPLPPKQLGIPHPAGSSGREKAGSSQGMESCIRPTIESPKKHDPGEYPSAPLKRESCTTTFVAGRSETSAHKKPRKKLIPAKSGVFNGIFLLRY